MPYYDSIKCLSWIVSLQSFRSLWSNERLLNVAEQLLGTNDIAGHPVWNLRTKTPQNEATTVPWHQGEPLVLCITITEVYDGVPCMLNIALCA